MKKKIDNKFMLGISIIMAILVFIIPLILINNFENNGVSPNSRNAWRIIVFYMITITLIFAISCNLLFLKDVKIKKKVIIWRDNKNGSYGGGSMCNRSNDEWYGGQKDRDKTQS